MPDHQEPTRTIPPAVAQDATRDLDPGPTGNAPNSHAPTGEATPTGYSPTSPVSSGRYILGELISSGGMGDVYRATDTVLGREVAVKVLQHRYTPDCSAARRFADEARIAGQLQHPNIPAVHDLGTLPNGRPFLAMKLIKGSTLDELLKHRSDTSHDRGRFVAAFEQVCQALAYAHAHNVIHRDLKPANVMVGAFGEVQVMDWGLAKVLGSRGAEPTAADETAAPTAVVSLRDCDDLMTRAGSIIGTPAFMSPEQAVGAVETIDKRSDVFGLGAVLAVVLTGHPPYVADSTESTRVKAARGDVADCFLHLHACGADPELVELCKRCLAPRQEERPRDGGEVAEAVAALRSAADERARQAELARVRRRSMIGAAAVLVVAAVGGLSILLAVQWQANALLEAKNAELDEKKAEAEARFEAAQKAIATLHTGVSEDFLLKNPEFQELRTKLLKEAAIFYSNLEKLLVAKTDPKSRKLLADGYFQLGELTARIGDQKEALAVQRKALVLRRGLAAVPDADVETRLDVARSLRAVALVLRTTGDTAEMMLAFEEQRDLAAALEAESPTESVRTQLAHSHNGIGNALWDTGKLPEAVEEWQQALAIRQKLVDANSAVPEFQRDLCVSHFNIAIGLYSMGQRAKAVKEYQKALAIQQKVVDANTGVTMDQSVLASIHGNLGDLLSKMGQPTEGLQELREALVIQQKLADAYPAVTRLQSELAIILRTLGRLHAREKRFSESFAALDRGIAIGQKLAEAHPTIEWYATDLGYGQASRGWAHVRAGHPVEAAADLRRALALWEKQQATNIQLRFERGRVLALLAGLAADGKSGVTPAEAAAFAGQAVAALCDAHHSAWGQYDELKEPDFDALRKREDFQKLIAEQKR